MIFLARAKEKKRKKIKKNKNKTEAITTFYVLDIIPIKKTSMTIKFC